MKLKHLISTSTLIFAGIPSANASDPIYMCKSCPAGSYSSGGSAKSCTPCPVGQYQDGTGASGCKTCHGNTNPTSVSGKNCGSVTVDVTGYCRATGSTSSTANAAKVGTTTINLGNCSGNTYCSNNVCTACSKPANSEWDSGSGCGWHCASGYEKSGDSCIKTSCKIEYQIINRNCKDECCAVLGNFTETTENKTVILNRGETYTLKTAEYTCIIHNQEKKLLETDCLFDLNLDLENILSGSIYTFKVF